MLTLSVLPDWVRNSLLLPKLVQIFPFRRQNGVIPTGTLHPPSQKKSVRVCWCSFKDSKASNIEHSSPTIMMLKSLLLYFALTLWGDRVQSVLVYLFRRLLLGPPPHGRGADRSSDQHARRVGCHADSLSFFSFLFW